MQSPGDEKSGNKFNTGIRGQRKAGLPGLAAGASLQSPGQ
jgi:hypothetical protein